MQLGKEGMGICVLSRQSNAKGCLAARLLLRSGEVTGSPRGFQTEASMVWPPTVSASRVQAEAEPCVYLCEGPPRTHMPADDGPTNIQGLPITPEDFSCSGWRC